jgi:putative aldouronate transport system substrate-binding protein
MKRFILVALTLIVSACFVFASGGSGESTAGAGDQLNPPGTYPITKQPATFSAVTIFGTNESSGKLTDNKLDLYLQKLTNVKVIWKDVIDSNVATEKINLILASGDLPDVIMTPWQISVQQAFIYGSQGTFIPVESLVKERMPGIAAQFEKFPDYKKQLVAPDGHMYAFPYLEAGCFHCTMSNKFWVYQPWLTKLGLKAPTTTDEFYNMLKAFKTRDPNGNGKADEIPLIGSVDGWQSIGGYSSFIQNAFTYTNTSNYMKRENGKVTFIAPTPEYREALKYMAKLYKEGLIAPESYVQKTDQALATVENPTVPLVGSFAAGWFGVYTVNNGGTGRFADFQPIAPIAGPTGLRQSTFAAQPCSPHTFITKAAKNPKTIASWVDWFYQDPLYAKSTMGWEFGQENSTEAGGWRVATAEEQKSLVSRDGLPGITILIGPVRNYGKDKYDDGYTRAAPRWDWRDWSGMPTSWASDPSKQEWRLMVATRDLMLPFKADKSMPPNLVFPAAVQQEFADASAALVGATGVVPAWSSQFVTGAKNINDDGDWNAFVAELKKAGYERYEKIWSDTVKAAGY